LLLLIAAIDERFQLHESFKRWLLFQQFDGDRDAMGRIGDLPMLAYALIGAVVIRWFWRRLERGRLWIIGAVVVGAIAIAFDIATERVGPQMIEEVLEITAETLFLCGLVTALRSAWRTPAQSPK
jgi:hypothetical protein